MLLGVISLQSYSKPKYRIETWVEHGQRYYLPQQRVWYRTNYFYLPFKVWRAGAYPFKYQTQAEEIINNWKADYKEKFDYKHSEYILIK